MRNRRKWSTFAAVLGFTGVLLGAGTRAHAITYGPDCGSGNCFGSVYDLTYTNLANVYTFTLNVDTSLFNNFASGASGLDGVAIKVVSSANDITINSFSSTAGFTSAGEVGLSGSIVNGSGCGGGGGGWLCAYSSATGGVPIGPGLAYEFTWNTTILPGQLLNENDWSIKALYVNSAGDARGLTSVTGGVPLPGTTLMFGLGFALFFGWHHRSRYHLRSGGFAA